ncbi:MAG: T9SS type A sorting domain-containing protein [Bacteroidetes bacterium]|nr:T9SS type A sorting domain-containing protein [Bacteroidota bacterium]
MIANGYDVAVIEDHVATNPFQNVYSLARHSYYGGGGVPNAWFDGVTNSLGGISGGNMYSYYLPKYNQRIAVPSNFTIAMNGFNDGLDFTILVTVENVEPYAGNNLVLQFTLTESHIPHSWGSLTEVNHVNRFMAPDQFGTALDFSGNATQAVELDFSADPSWVIENCELVAFVQDNDTKEILQGFKVAVPDLMPMFFDNANCLDISMVPVTNCTGEVAPRVAISNGGASNLTSLEINYQVNEETLNTFNWSGDLGYGEMEEVDLPAVPFDIMDENDLVIYTTNPNGNPDEDPMNDTTYTSFNSAVDAIPDIQLYLKLDDNPEEISWELQNSSGDVLYSGGSYTQPQAFIQETLELTEDDCYTFYIFDEGGDGLASPGFFRLMDGNFDLIYENEDFSTESELVQFAIDLVGIENPEASDAFNVFPNPFHDYTNINFSVNQPTDVEVIVYNMIGKCVFDSGLKSYNAGDHTVTINGADLNKGIYFVTLKQGNEVFTRKVTLH